MSDEAAKALAWQLRRDLDLTTVRAIDIEDLLAEMEVLVLDEQPLGGKAEAMSLELAERDIIFAPKSGNPRRRRFTLGHELGHLLLEHGSAACLAADIHGKAKSPQEREANVFSSRLLLPSRLFRNDIRRVQPRFSEIAGLAELYEVSMTAAAIRYVEETKDPCALLGVRSYGGDVWVMKSGSVGWWVRNIVSPATLIFDHVHGNSRYARLETDAREWLEDFAWQGDWTLREEVFQVSDGEWLVLLSEIPDREDDPDLVDREVDEELTRRRNQFRLH